ncbi:MULTISPECIES: MurR/RpiR family transcriptional regulator [Cohaesibacter]|uniref:MurR/RpiR family transcriptional regulator n=1 Tax=Cohaesibacter TaxID=655352 RepID=UPI000DEA6C4C|nr:MULTISPECIES: MurR/RpiR family transcriptional regulator [Cohaesibacter]TLP46859.1 MurR/RpiR family transcriptional regulator [Cohaesibacter sp. CAU 1516]
MSIKDRIAGHYGELSERLRQAADYVAAHEMEVATYSLRAVSGRAGLAPATFTRLSQALGFANYEEMRDLCRAAVGRQALSFAQRADLLVQEQHGADAPTFFDRQVSACLNNISMMGSELDRERLFDVVKTLDAAREVHLFGAFSSSGLIEYFAYLARYFAKNWRVAGRMGASLSSSLVGLSEEDALIIITKSPYARRSILAAQMAHEAGAYVFVITDKHSCPALEFSSSYFIVPTDSPQFFSSYAATLVLIETIVGMLVHRAGKEARARIEEVETRNHLNGEFWD